MDALKISLEYFERDANSNIKEYSNGHKVTFLQNRIARTEFPDEDTQPQHKHLRDKLRFFNIRKSKGE